ncbi:MAG: MerR family transcriptional regulator [Burkholderiaceae bacterium]|jgi:DNA-binding transcriptional MerR regulator|nr:MerR family transcriptional regulator [Burkholderiaceae bacterium]
MSDQGKQAASTVSLPAIPAKRYFTIGEVSELCGVKPHVLRYWEQNFTQIRQVRRRGNRRYYQHHEILLIRRIRELLYEQGFTISGAKARLEGYGASSAAGSELESKPVDVAHVRSELEQIRQLLVLPEKSRAKQEEVSKTTE